MRKVKKAMEKDSKELITAIAKKPWKCEIIGKRFALKEGQLVELTAFEFQVLAGADVVSIFKKVHV